MSSSTISLFLPSFLRLPFMTVLSSRTHPPLVQKFILLYCHAWSVLLQFSEDIFRRQLQQQLSSPQSIHALKDGSLRYQRPHSRLTSFRCHCLCRYSAQICQETYNSLYNCCGTHTNLPSYNQIEFDLVWTRDRIYTI